MAQQVILHHPELTPIECRAYRLRERIATLVDDVRLRFSSEQILPTAGFLELTIRALGEAQTFVAQVVCCDKAERGFEAQVCFLNREDAYRARIIEQICHIEAYRWKVEKEQGRKLLMDGAAEEWIQAHAPHFPSF